MTRTMRQAHRADERHPVRDALDAAAMFVAAVALLGLWLAIAITLYVVHWARS